MVKILRFALFAANAGYGTSVTRPETSNPKRMESFDRRSLMSKGKETLSDAERKEAREHSRRFGKWLRQGMNSDRQESTEAKKQSPREAA